MLTVEIYRAHGKPTQQETLGRIWLARGKLQYQANSPQHDTLFRNIMRATLRVGKRDIPPTDPEAWLKNLHAEYRSYALRAGEAVDVK